MTPLRCDWWEHGACVSLLSVHDGKILKHLVRRYAFSSGEFYEDLLQLGHVGLMKATNTTGGNLTPTSVYADRDFFCKMAAFERCQN